MRRSSERWRDDSVRVWNLLPAIPGDGPLAFARALYVGHDLSNHAGHPGPLDPGQRLAWATPALHAALLPEDAREADALSLAIPFDTLTGVEDWDVARLETALADANDRSAQVAVTAINAGIVCRLTLHLESSDAGWRLDEVTGIVPLRWSLRERLATFRPQH